MVIAPALFTSPCVAIQFPSRAANQIPSLSNIDPYPYIGNVSAIPQADRTHMSYWQVSLHNGMMYCTDESIVPYNSSMNQYLFPLRRPWPIGNGWRCCLWAEAWLGAWDREIDGRGGGGRAQGHPMHLTTDKSGSVPWIATNDVSAGRRHWFFPPTHRSHGE